MCVFLQDSQQLTQCLAQAGAKSVTFTELITMLGKAPTAELQSGGSLGPHLGGQMNRAHRGHHVLMGWAQAVARKL